MARTSYLARRDGRYFIQVRFSVRVAPLIGQPLYRASLRTSEYGVARMRLNECLSWLLPMNDAPDYMHLFQINVRDLAERVLEQSPYSEDRLIARQRFEELLKNLNRRAQAVGFDATVAFPDYYDLFKRFVEQNVEGEQYLRHGERVREYERGRADVQAALKFGAIQRPDTHPHVAQVKQPSSTPGPLFSKALADYTDEKRKAGASGDTLNDVRLTVEFIIARFGDVRVELFDANKTGLLDSMLPDIPDRKGIPRTRCTSLADRYDYAREQGWDGLKRLTEARLRNGYHNALSKFFGWLIKNKLYPHPQPVFKTVSGKNLVSLPRDSFQYDEIVDIFSQPLFTGCKAASRIWQPGTYLVQSHLYWAYVILVLHGVRIGEIGQIEINDIVVKKGVHYFDLRGFNPDEGRVAIEDVRNFKTPSSERVIPIHPLVIELGLLNRAEELKARGCGALFPEWKPYIKHNGDYRWGQPVTKSWDYLKDKIGIKRKNVTAYSTRHLFADFVDSTDMSQRSRQRIMGHSVKGDVPAGYGAKGQFSTKDLEKITAVEAPEIEFMVDTLLKAKAEADAGHLTMLKPWLQRENWSEHYRAKYE